MTTLTSQQRAQFDGAGVLRLPGFFAAADIAAMADALWDDLGRRLGMRPAAPETWTTAHPAQFQALIRSGAFAALGSPALSALGDAFLGAGAWELPRRWGQPLVSFPAGAWYPRVMWHLDFPADDDDAKLPAIRLFTFLESVAPGGGGTVYVAGSHRVAMDIARAAGAQVRSADMQKRLRGGVPWFADLWPMSDEQVREALGKQAEVNGVSVRVEEMTGEPGDLIVMHPTLLHGLARNFGDRPRLMLVETLYRRA